MKFALSENMRPVITPNLVTMKLGLHCLFPEQKVALTKELVYCIFQRQSTKAFLKIKVKIDHDFVEN